MRDGGRRRKCVWAILCLCCVLAAGAKYIRVPQRTAPPADCLIGFGDNLDLCGIHAHPEGGLVLEFGRPVRTAFYWLTGPDARVDIWLRREDVGNLGLAQTHTPIGGELYRGIGTDPPYAAVRLVGRIETIEDVVYGDSDE